MASGAVKDPPPRIKLDRLHESPGQSAQDHGSESHADRLPINCSTLLQNEAVLKPVSTSASASNNERATRLAHGTWWPSKRGSTARLSWSRSLAWIDRGGAGARVAGCEFVGGGETDTEVKLRSAAADHDHQRNSVLIWSEEIFLAPPSTGETRSSANARSRSGPSIEGAGCRPGSFASSKMKRTGRDSNPRYR